MASTQFTEKTEIRCRPEFAFDYTQDYERRLAWDTFLKKAQLIAGAQTAGVGVKAYCVSKYGLGMTTGKILTEPKRKTQ
jgi:hypothetical protein